MIDLKVGNCFYEKKSEVYKYHVVAILENEEQIVFKYFGKRKQWWHYEIKSFYEYETWVECGLYFKK